jgi:hypothetical protein
MSDFFAIGAAEWREACALGINPAVSFLVLACGTGHDNQTSSWSANAVQTYGGISWIRAKPAIDALAEAGLIQIGGTRTKPRYKLRISEDRIWLPKSIVIPLAGEIPALTRIRQVQDVMTLRLFIELYYSQNLAANGGLSRSVYFVGYKKTVYCEHGQYIFFGFDQENTYVAWETEITKAHRVEVSKAEQKEGKNPAQILFKRMATLCGLGLLEYSVCLFESDDKEAEYLYPVDGPTPDEKAVQGFAQAAAEAVLPEWQMQNNPHEYLVPVYRHQEKVEMFGIFRLRHRPHTSLTAAWWTNLQTRIDDAVKVFKTITG